MHNKNYSELLFLVAYFRNRRAFKKTTTATSCRTSPNNTVNEQNNETAREKYNLVSFSAVLCKTRIEQFTSFVENMVARR